MLTFLSFLWVQEGYHTRYTDAHVRRWADMIRAHYTGPHRIVLVTDQAGDFGDVEVLPLWSEGAELANPHGPGLPSCYRRLRLWAPDAAERFGEHVLLLDLDCTILGDLAPLVNRPEDVVLWRDPSYPIQPYNGGMILLRTGSRPQVWARFRGETSIREARAAGYKGSDQAWIAHVLGRNEAVWTAADGVVSWKRDLRRGLPRRGDRIVMFHGKDKPWHEGMPAELKRAA
jgi:hypothetical protein